MSESGHPQELRQTVRKILRCRAFVHLETGDIMQGQTLDISLGGVCVVLENSMRTNALCDVRLEIFLEGKTSVFLAKARVLSSICTKQTYRTGLQFLALEPGQVQLINKIP